MQLTHVRWAPSFSAPQANMAGCVDCTVKEKRERSTLLYIDGFFDEC